MLNLRKLSRWLLPFWLVCCILCSCVFAERSGSLVPGGSAVGLCLELDGVLVTGFPEQSGSPAESAGIRIGDRITAIDRRQVRSTEDISAILADASGQNVELTVERDGGLLHFTVTPQLRDGVKRLGLLVKDHVNGIGTLTYYDPENGRFGALGHAVKVQNDTERPLQNGSLCAVKIVEIRRGTPGSPGSLYGTWSEDAPLGRIDRNLPQGVFGTLAAPRTGERVPVADEEELIRGAASILCTLDGGSPAAYSIEITDVRPNDPNGRNLQFRVTDPVLLDAAGGIVQGISGAPILQNEKLIGAVTHVLVDSPERGYGIYIGNMLDADAA